MNKIFQLDLRSLAAMRIAAGLLLLYDLVWRLRDLEQWYTDVGAVPRRLVVEEYWNPVWWCLHLYSGTVTGSAVLLLLTALAACMLAAGFKTRYASVGCYILLLSLHNRNPLVLDSGDRLFLLLLFWGMFLPWEARYSWDARRQREAWAGRDVVVLLGGMGYLLQIVQMYFMSGLWKLHPAWLTERTALLRVMKLEQFTKPLGYWLVGHPGLMELLSLGTVLLEGLGPLLLLAGNNRWRLLGVLAFAGLHGGIGLTMDLEFFPLVSLTVLIGLLPSMIWRGACDATGQLAPAARWSEHPVVQALATLAALLTLGWNMMIMANQGDIPASANGRHAWLGQSVAAFRLVQIWTLFAPLPRPIDSRYMIEARLSDGTTVDLLRDGASFPVPRSSLPSAEFRDQRQRNFLSALEYSVGDSFRLRYLRRMAILWNSEHPDRAVQWVRLLSQRQDIRLDGSSVDPYLVELAWTAAQGSSWQGPLLPPDTSPTP